MCLSQSGKPVLYNMPKTKHARRSGNAHRPEREHVSEKWFLYEQENRNLVSMGKIYLHNRKVASNMEIKNFNGNLSTVAIV